MYKENKNERTNSTKARNSQDVIEMLGPRQDKDGNERGPAFVVGAMKPPPPPTDLVAFLPYACGRLGAPFCVHVDTRIQEEYVSKLEDKPKKQGKKIETSTTTMSSRLHRGSLDDDEESGPNGSGPAGIRLLVLTAVYNVAGQLVELDLHRCKEIPRLLVQILALCVPFLYFLTKLSVRWNFLRGEVLYEIAKLTRLSTITEVCLDDSPVAAKNYHLLLELESLKSLSLARCDIGHEECALLAGRLVHPRPGSRGLAALCLPSNGVGDAGAAALAVALRSNRSLLLLNLADNRITDAGAASLFRSLAEFPLTLDEILTKRRRYIEFLKMRKVAYDACVGQMSEQLARGGGGRRTGGGARPGRGTAANVAYFVNDSISTKVEAMVNDTVGTFKDPFERAETVVRRGHEYCVGNTVLSCLNLSYNEVGAGGVAALRRTLEQQAGVGAGAGGRRAGTGLLRVALDGNPLPAQCDHFAPIQALLDLAVQQKQLKPIKKLERKSRAMVKD